VDDPVTLLETAFQAAAAATRVHLAYLGAVGVEGAAEKANSDFVTRVDLEAQEAALSVIRARHPDHRILAEEQEPAEGPAAYPPDGTPLWIVDPLDGTTNFLHGHPHFAASVAAGWNGDVVAGVVEAGASGERWWAVRGGGAWKDGRRIRVSGLRSLERALVGTGFPFKALHLLPAYLGQLGRVLTASGGVRRCGSAALDLCFVATGILDAFWEEEYLSPWDVAAGSLVVQEAGGIVSRIDGNPLDLRPGSVLAANSPELHGALGRVVRKEGSG